MRADSFGDEVLTMNLGRNIRSSGRIRNFRTLTLPISNTCVESQGWILDVQSWRGTRKEGSQWLEGSGQGKRVSLPLVP